MNTSNQPIASIIVLAYNDRKYLEGCISSLLDQNIPSQEYEIIYADNASTDGSIDFVRQRFPQVRIINFEKNYGFAEGNNKAASFAHGRYLAFQNADTIVHRHWLSELIKAMESDPRIKAAHPAGLPLNFNGHNERQAHLKRGVMCDLTRFGYVDFTETDLDGHLTPTLHVAGGSLLIDPAILTELVYYFDPNYFIYNEDTDLGIRINNLGYRVVFVSSAVAYHQRDPSRRTELNKKGLRMAYLVTRNRFITFYKNMQSIEFLVALPLIFLGSMVKLRTMPMNRFRKIIYTVGLIPFTFYSFLMAVLQFSKYSKKRKHIISNSRRERYWLIRELWKRNIPPHSPLVDGVNPYL